jgi:hypothetical protein
MPLLPSPAQQSASRVNGARSRDPATDKGKARAARNSTRHGLRGGPFALLPGEDAEELAALERAVAADWHPRDAYERHWVRELVAAMWRQDRLRGLELSALAAAEAEHPVTEATMKRLLTFARYGARLDGDMGRALRALRILRDRPDASLAETAPPSTPETERRPPPPARTDEPKTSASAAEPRQALAASAPSRPLNRHERRRLEALERKKVQRRAA